MAEALIVIDMAEGYMKDTSSSKKVISNISKLIQAFKKKGNKVILSMPKFDSKRKNPVMIRLWGEEFKDDPESQKLVKELSNFKFDKKIEKVEYSGFYKTDLERYCKKHDITNLYFTGVFSGCCIFFSAVDAAYRMIQPHLVTDASGAPKGKLINKSWHQDTIKRFKLMIGPAISTKKLIDKMK
ncbi:cysteine hydrolase [Candidatus Woesearchaeota archaeon]|nr:cysteine hydrolase [Candidatus Woesearchaeota archaeon]